MSGQLPKSAQNYDQVVNRIENLGSNTKTEKKTPAGRGLSSKLLELALVGTAAANTYMAIDWRPNPNDNIVTPEPQRAPLVQTDSTFDVARKDAQFQVERVSHQITENAANIREAAETGVNGVSAIGLSIAALQVNAYRRKKGYTGKPNAPKPSNKP